MRIHKLIKGLAIGCLISLLVACGGSGGENVVPGGGGSAGVLSGQVADGYLSGARVFLDRNGNRSLDAGEPWTESGAQGHYSLEVQAGEGELYPVVAEIIAGQTMDEDQAPEYVAESYRLEAPVGKWSFISPLTTLVKNELDKNPSLSLAAAEARIRAQLGLGTSISLFEDYVQAQGNLMLQHAQRAARVIAGLMGGLQAGIELNVGAAQAESQTTAVGLMISDQIMNNSNTIALGLASAIDSAAIEGLKTVIMAAISTPNLDSALLARYVEQIQAASPVWDMTAPRILSLSPLVAGSASIDVVISLTFDEAIDPASILDNSVQLIGPNGAVAGTINYDPALKQLSFVPLGHLMAFSSYQVELAGIADNSGNSLEQTQGWNFTTIFDQLPPALPDF